MAIAAAAFCLLCASVAQAQTPTTPTVSTIAVTSNPGTDNTYTTLDVITVTVTFSEAPKESFSYKTLRDHAFTVTGGEVTNARRLEQGKNIRWEITVQPSGNAGVTIILPVTTDCDAPGAVCTEDGRKLSQR